jgi:anthranilate phosphoribosyltransferase
MEYSLLDQINRRGKVFCDWFHKKQINYLMKDPLGEYNRLLESGEDLNTDQVRLAARHLTDDQVEESQKYIFLQNLAIKGETNEEFSGFVSAFRKMAKNPQLEEFSADSIDLCGTGGDLSGSFNISTFVSLVVAAAGVSVIKHGNRSISSSCGSADLLEALGIPMETDPQKLKSSLTELNFCFLFAPHFHPAFKSLAPIRKKLAEQGTITMFNRLGPCLNPAVPAHQILGVYDSAYLSQIAHCLAQNGGKSGWVVHGVLNSEKQNRMDELTACGTNCVQPYGTLGNTELSLKPDHWGMETHPPTHLRGGNLKQNLKIFQGLLSGNAPTGLLATVHMNISTALWIAGKVASLDDGIIQAKGLLEDGTVSRWIQKAQNFFSR